MSVKLQKGQKVNLSKDHAGLSRIVVGLGWDEVEQPRGFFHLSLRRLTAMHSRLCFKMVS